tara:strand:+ start:388 stop:642 length:255 start_codon:yes stop_codon:yes gene_type:complete
MSSWIKFVADLSKEKGIKYNEALKIASPLYHKKMGTTPKPKSDTKPKKHKIKVKDVVDKVSTHLKSGELHSKSSKKKIRDALSN